MNYPTINDIFEIKKEIKKKLEGECMNIMDPFLLRHVILQQGIGSRVVSPGSWASGPITQNSPYQFLPESYIFKK